MCISNCRIFVDGFVQLRNYLLPLINSNSCPGQVKRGVGQVKCHKKTSNFNIDIECPC